MSATIDRRIVQMEFENRTFEVNAKNSMSTIEKLKKVLNFDSSKKSINELSDAGKKFTLLPMTDGLDIVTDRFTTLGIIGVTALQNITNSVINTGKQMLSSLTIDPISQGFQEYELKMDSIQTIMAGTGESLETVSGYLDELNTYADRTIYSFSDMTSSIGKFTNAGVDLKSAVKAIQGISNEAALSGANAQQASHAMYNFAQSLSSGAVKLIDWKSIETANMATKEFKEQLIETAVEVGTLVKQGDMFVSTTTDLNGKVSDAFDSVKNFNDSLSSQWMTTDVLVQTLGKYSDETTDLGARAFAAAQDVKTFSQMMDALKEAVGSGWASTFEIVVGDFNQAKTLWTGINNVVGEYFSRQSEARNSMLKEWASLAGRRKAIEAMSNALTFFYKLIKPIGDAWNEIFPPMTGRRLTEITNVIVKFTRSLKVTDTITSNLKDLFKGLFSVLDLLKSAFITTFSFIFGSIPDLSSFVNLIISLAGSFGRWIQGITAAAKSVNIFELAASKINEILSASGSKFDIFRKGFEKVSNIKFDVKPFENLSGFIENLKKQLPSLSDILDSAGKSFSSFVNFIGSGINPEKVGEFIGNMINGLASAFDGFKKGLTNAFGEIDFNSIVDAFKTGLIIPILYTIGTFSKDVFGSLSDAFDNFKSMFEGPTEFLESASENINGILESVKGTLIAYQSQIKAKALMEIAKAIALLTGAIVVLSMIDGEKLKTALIGLSLVFAELIGGMYGFQKFISGANLAGTTKVISTMIAMSTSVLILSGAVKKLADLDMNDMSRGLIGVGVLLAAMVTAANKLSVGSGIIKGSIGMILFAESINILIKAVEPLGSLDTETLIKGLIGVGVLITELGLMISATDFKGFGVFKSVGLIGLAVALNILIKAVEPLGSLDTETLIKGLIGVGVLITELGLMISATDFKGFGVFKSVGLIGLAVALNILIKAVEPLGSLDTETLIKGLIGVGTILAEVGLFVSLAGDSKRILSSAVALVIISKSLDTLTKSISSMGGLTDDVLTKGLFGMAAALTTLVLATRLMPRNLPAIGVGLAIVSASLNILSNALTLLGNFKDDQISSALLTLGASLLTIVIAMNLMKGTIGGAASLILVAVGLNALAPALLMFSKMGLKEIGLSLLALAGIFVIIGGAALILQPLVPTIFSLSVSMLAMGVSVLAFSAGLAGFAIAATIFVTGMMSIISVGATAAEAIVNGAPLIKDAVVALIKALVGALVESLPMILSGVGQLIVGLLNSLIAYGPTIIGTVLILLTELLEALIAAMPMIVQTAIDLVVGFVNALANAIRDNTDVILGAVKNLMGAVIEFILSALQELVGAIPGIGNKLSGYLEAGKEKVRETFAPSEMQQIGSDAVSATAAGMTSREAELRGAAANTGASARDALNSEFQNTEKDGADMITGYLQGAMSKEGEAGETGSLINNQMIESLTGSSELFENAGIEDIQGFIDGSVSLTPEVENSGEEVASSGVDGTENVIPEFKIAGENATMGFAEGIRSKIDEASKASAEMARASYEAAMAELDIHSPSRVFGKIGDYTGEGFVRHLRAYAEESSLAGKHVANAAVHSMTEAVSRISDAIDSKIDTSPVITPVLDLTNVTKGSSQISAIFSRNQAVIAAREYNDGKVAEVNMEVANMQRMNAQNMNYMRELAQAINTSKVPVNVQIGLEGDAKQIFKVVRNENDKFTTATNYNPLARQRAVRS